MVSMVSYVVVPHKRRRLSIACESACCVSPLSFLALLLFVSAPAVPDCEPEDAPPDVPDSELTDGIPEGGVSWGTDGDCDFFSCSICAWSSAIFWFSEVMFPVSSVIFACFWVLSATSCCFSVVAALSCCVLVQ